MSHFTNCPTCPMLLFDNNEFLDYGPHETLFIYFVINESTVWKKGD